MDIIQSSKLYINKIIEYCGSGMKVLLMDKDTTTIISMVFTQSDMLAKEVYLFERIGREAANEKITFIKCIIFVRPTPENISLIEKELKHPKYGQYFIYFTNIISTNDIKQIAEADDYEVVKELKEIYCDYIAVSPHLFSFGITTGCYNGSKKLWNQNSLRRTIEGIGAVLLSLRKRPTLRYQASSEICKRLGEGIKSLMNKEGSLFDFSLESNLTSYELPPVFLILDRQSDPISPLLNQWTYQAMLHELLIINNNRINLVDVPGITKDMKEVILSPEHDQFYEYNMYLNYGEIGSNIKGLMEQFQTKTKSQQKVESISDMKSFIEQYPQFRKMSGTVSKHVTLIGELSRMITYYNLFEVSEAEQELSSHSDRSESFKKVKKLIAMEKVRNIDALRLVMLYEYRHEKQPNDIKVLLEMLRTKGLSDEEIRLVDKFHKYSRNAQSSGELTQEKVTSFTKKMIKGLKGVENIYTQHVPLLKEIVEDLVKGRLKPEKFPYLGTVVLHDKPQEIIVFIVGGTTYEESLVIHQLNKTFPGTKIILGSSFVHNFSSFMSEIKSATTVLNK